jgi:hypothetical protein
MNIVYFKVGEQKSISVFYFQLFAMFAFKKPNVVEESKVV